MAVSVGYFFVAGRVEIVELCENNNDMISVYNVHNVARLPHI